MTDLDQRVSAAIDILREGLDVESLEPTGVMERALAALTEDVSEPVTKAPTDGPPYYGLSEEFRTHQWANTFLGSLFPLVCSACMVRSDSPEAEVPCDRAAAGA